jgi:hypothetical protein
MRPCGTSSPTTCTPPASRPAPRARGWRGGRSATAVWLPHSPRTPPQRTFILLAHQFIINSSSQARVDSRQQQQQPISRTALLSRRRELHVHWSPWDVVGRYRRNARDSHGHPLGGAMQERWSISSHAVPCTGSSCQLHPPDSSHCSDCLPLRRATNDGCVSLQ